MSQQPFSTTGIDDALPLRTRGRRLFKVLLYIVGMLFAATGVLGAIASLADVLGISGFSGYIVLFFELVVVIASIIIFFRKRYKAPCLRWSQYLWWILGASGVAIMALSLGVGTVPSTGFLSAIALSFIVLFYGIGLVWIALLKPSLRQQVDESVRRTLNAMPGKQMVLADLVNLTQLC